MGACTHPLEFVRQPGSPQQSWSPTTNCLGSGPSHADQLIIRCPRDALAPVDFRLLERIVVAGGGAASFSECEVT
jgi:hypothetical protein